MKESPLLDRSTVSQLEHSIREEVGTKKVSLIAVVGSPGSGKSRCARYIAENGFLSIPKDQLFVIDDLRHLSEEKDFENSRRRVNYRPKELYGLVNELQNKVLFLFDFRAAKYLKRVDTLILLHVEELERLKNLRSRSERGHRRYRKRVYRIPPVPLGFRWGRSFVCKEDFLNILRDAG